MYLGIFSHISRRAITIYLVAKEIKYSSDDEENYDISYSLRRNAASIIP